MPVEPQLTLFWGVYFLQPCSHGSIHSIGRRVEVSQSYVFPKLTCRYGKCHCWRLFIDLGALQQTV